MVVKFLYCPKCKELRVKPWYARTERCSLCRGPVRGIPVQPTRITYVKYTFMALVFVLVILEMSTDSRSYLYLAILALVVTMAISYADMLRGENQARARIRVTKADLRNPKVRRRLQH